MVSSNPCLFCSLERCVDLCRNLSRHRHRNFGDIDLHTVKLLDLAPALQKRLCMRAAGFASAASSSGGFVGASAWAEQGTSSFNFCRVRLS